MFSLLAGKFLEGSGGGIIYGATYDDNMNVKHVCIDDKKDIVRLQCSKYVQSNMGQSFREIHEYLEKGIHVFFSGTSCQIAGLKKYLRKDYNNLVTQAVICHGVPSPALWKKYVKYEEGRHHGRLIKINMRDKTNGWEKPGMLMTFDTGEVVYENSKDNIWRRLFGSNLILRRSCYNCKFKYPVFVADITLGDFWNAKTTVPEVYCDRGTSLIFISSKKGEALLESISNEISYVSVSHSDALKSNKGICTSTPYNNKRDDFYRNITEENIAVLADKLTKPSVLQRIRNQMVAPLYRKARYYINKYNSTN